MSGVVPSHPLYTFTPYVGVVLLSWQFTLKVRWLKFHFIFQFEFFRHHRNLQNVLRVLSLRRW
jgi:hypothetical protein